VGIVSGYLLDTHVFLWLLADDPQLSPAVRAAALGRHSTLLLSVVTAIELAIKVKAGKLKLSDPIEQLLGEGAARFHMLELPLRQPHALKLGHLPLHHRDPFDRLLVAQADFEGLTLLSQGPQMQKYGIPVVS
jgi:PIN domain nuclease of toxin-antitoxin system